MNTIKDVAKLSGCSRTTVSFVINDHPLKKNIPESTQKRIWEAIKELDYVPNEYAKMLKRGIPPTVGILSFDIVDPYCATVLCGIEEYLNRKEFFYRLVNVHNDLDLLRRFFNDARGRSIRGIIAIVNSLAFSISSDELSQLLRDNMKLISIGQSFPDLNVSSIQLDNRETARLGIEHLYHLGHREIAFIVGPLGIPALKARWNHVRETCNEYGIEMREELIGEIKNLPVTSASGVEMLRQIMERKVSFTAVMTFDDLVAYGVIQELCRSGLSVPGDVSVIGSDDIWPSEAYNPPLTTLRQPMMEMGRKSAELMVGALTSNDSKKRAELPKEIVMKPGLVVRETTAPAKRS